MNAKLLAACALLPLGAVGLSSPSTAQAQQASEWSQQVSFGLSIEATIRQYARTHGYNEENLVFRARERTQALVNNDDTWFAILRWVWGPNRWKGPHDLFTGYPVEIPSDVLVGRYDPDDIDWPFGGIECDEYRVEVDEFGNYKLPTLPLVPGGPIVNGDTVYRSLQMVDYQYEMADSDSAAAQWGIHHYNVGKPPNEWCYFFDQRDAETFQGYCPPHRNINGSVVDFQTIQATVVTNSLMWTRYNLEGGSEDCPPEGFADGGTTHFYTFSNLDDTDSESLRRQNGCTMYEPNFDLSPSGYGYPVLGAYPNHGTAERAFERNPAMRACRISPDFLRAMADYYLVLHSRDYNNEFDYTIPVTIADARKAGSGPLIGDSLHRNPAADWTGSGGQPVAPPDQGTPPDGYTPPVRPDGGGGSGGDGSDPNVGDGTGDGAAIDLSHPDVPEGNFDSPDLEMPEWVPSLPQFYVPAPAEGCPEFQFSAFGNEYRLDSHCTFANQNTALLASIMTVVWTLAAAFIVLRA